MSPLLGRLSSLVPDGFLGDPPAVGNGDTRQPDAPDEIDLFIYDDPENPCGGYWQGWMLTVRQVSTWRWSLALAGHGAVPSAETRAAKAVAVRVLAELGIRVESWADGPVGGLPIYRAVLDTGPDRHTSAPRARWTPPDQGRRRDVSPGH